MSRQSSLEICGKSFRPLFVQVDKNMVIIPKNYIENLEAFPKKYSAGLFELVPHGSLHRKNTVHVTIRNVT